MATAFAGACRLCPVVLLSALFAPPAAARHVPSAPLVLLPMDGSFALLAGGATRLPQPLPTVASVTANSAKVADVRGLDPDARMTIEGPVWSLQPRARGPEFELGALGGGREWAPSLAHVSLDWQF